MDERRPPVPELVQECHRRQIKVVLDATFNHVGLTFWAFRDVRSRGASSRYAGWFAIKAFDDPKTVHGRSDAHQRGLHHHPARPQLEGSSDRDRRTSSATLTWGRPQGRPLFVCTLSPQRMRIFARPSRHVSAFFGTDR